jgi:hypothetical protein
LTEIYFVFAVSSGLLTKNIKPLKQSLMASSQAIDEFLRKLTTQTPVDSADKTQYQHLEDSILGNGTNAELQRLKVEVAQLSTKFLELEKRVDDHALECASVPSARGHWKRERNVLQEGLITEKITKFLQSWTKTYRCSFFCKRQCRNGEETCLRIHDNTPFTILAGEIRAMLLEGNSQFFTSLLTRSETFKSAPLCQQLGAELQVLIVEFKEQMKDAASHDS